MTSTAAPGRPAEMVVVAFHRLIGAAVSAYQPVSIFLANGPPPSGRLYLNNLHCTLSQTASGVYSGTFAVTSDASAPFPTSSAITAGVFTDAHK